MLTEVITRENSAKMKFQVRATTIGLMESLTLAIGQRTKWTGKVFLPGETERSTKALRAAGQWDPSDVGNDLISVRHRELI